MAELGSLARLIRSKNAGPFMMTLDVMFDDAASYRRVAQAGVLDKARIALLFGVAEADVEVFEHAEANAIKISYPRRFVQGDPEDGDQMGGQQYAPLVTLDIP